MRWPLSLLPLVAGCAGVGSVEPAPSPPQRSYRASGTEPFWSVTLADGRMRYEAPGEQPVDLPAPPRRGIPGGERYAGDRLSLDILRRPCSDGMSDRRYPDTVRVTVNGRALMGCGMPASADPLDGREWRIESIDGAPVPAPRPATLRFGEGRIAGTGGCNRLTGPYSLKDGQVVFGAIATTRMACPGPAMAQEARLLARLREPMTIEPRGDRVTLRGSSGTLGLIAVEP